MHVLAGRGMFEVELIGVKHHTRCSLGLGVRFSIDGFTDNWATDMRHMDAYLVRATGF